MVALAPNTSETSTWDILDGFPKLHSRAHEVKTRICTEAPHSKSLGRVEIWLVISESCVGLESFTRDPIGFDGSEWGLYEYCGAKPLDWFDPTGLKYNDDDKILILSHLPDFREGGLTITSLSLFAKSQGYQGVRDEPMGGWPPGSQSGFPMPIERCFSRLGPGWGSTPTLTPEERYGNLCAGEFNNRMQNCGQHNLNCMSDCDKIWWPYRGYKASKDNCDRAHKCCGIQGDYDLEWCLFTEGKTTGGDLIKKIGDLLAEHQKSKCKRKFGLRVPPIKNGPFDPTLF